MSARLLMCLGSGAVVLGGWLTTLAAHPDTCGWPLVSIAGAAAAFLGWWESL